MALSKFIAGTVVVGAMALSAGSASAITLNDGSGVLQGAGSVNTSTLSPEILEVDFNWTATSVTQFVDFTVTTLADLFFDEYVNGDDPISTAIFNQSSSITLDRLDMVGGDLTERLNTNQATCANAAAPIGGVGGCQLITSETSVGGVTAMASRPSVAPLFADLAAGSYRLGFHEVNRPSSGTASFTVVSEVTNVPLPAGIALFLSGLGLLGFVSRRKAEIGRASCRERV